MISSAMWSFGLILAAFGFAVRNSPDMSSGGYLGFVGVGAIFTILGLLSVAFPKPYDHEQFNFKEHRGPMQALGWMVIAFGLFGLLTATYAPSTIPSDGNASWTVWVFVAWFLWAILVGGGLLYIALKTTDE